MRPFLIVGVAIASIGGPAFAGSTPQMPHMNIAPTQVTTQGGGSVNNAGGSTSTTVQVGSVATSGSLAVKGSLVVNGSLSVANQGFSVP